MGNDHGIPLNQFLRVGYNVTQIVTQVDRDSEEDKLKKFVWSYYAGYKEVVKLSWKTTSDKEDITRLVRFKINQPGFINIYIEKTENNLLKIINSDELKKHGFRNFNYETKDRSGEITKTYVVYNGSEEEGCLFVVEEKRKSGVVNPYVVTLAHYYANYSEGFFGWKRYDAGLSKMVSITVVDHDMDFYWDDSHNNSSMELLRMFQYVCRTKTWKWDRCPYSYVENSSKQFIGMNKHLFKTNSETETETEDEEGSYVQLTKQIGSNVLANQGAIRGKNNCNMIVKNLYLKGRR